MEGDETRASFHESDEENEEQRRKNVTKNPPSLMTYKRCSHVFSHALIRCVARLAKLTFNAALRVFWAQELYGFFAMSFLCSSCLFCM